jgi:hypothetical protein
LTAIIATINFSSSLGAGAGTWYSIEITSFSVRTDDEAHDTLLISLVLLYRFPYLKTRKAEATPPKPVLSLGRTVLTSLGSLPCSFVFFSELLGV